jgi:hypothetical protein
MLRPDVIGDQGQISHYVAERTGEEYFSAPVQGYAAALEKILMQLYFRYELGFIPPVIEVDRAKRMSGNRSFYRHHVDAATLTRLECPARS